MESERVPEGTVAATRDHYAACGRPVVARICDELLALRSEAVGPEEMRLLREAVDAARRYVAGNIWARDASDAEVEAAELDAVAKFDALKAAVEALDEAGDG